MIGTLNQEIFATNNIRVFLELPPVAIFLGNIPAHASLLPRQLMPPPFFLVKMAAAEVGSEQEVAGLGDKRQVTAVFGCTLAGYIVGVPRKNQCLPPTRQLPSRKVHPPHPQPLVK